MKLAVMMGPAGCEVLEIDGRCGEVTGLDGEVEEVDVTGKKYEESEEAVEDDEGSEGKLALC